MITVGLDIDGTITELGKNNFIYNKMKEFYREELGMEFTGKFEIETYPDNEKFPDTPEYILKRFWPYYFRKLAWAPIKNGMKAFIDYLRENDYNIQIITARPTNQKGAYSGLIMVEETYEYMEKLGLRPNEIHFDCDDKLEAMREYKCDIMIDDCPEHLMKIGVHYPVVMMLNPWNKYLIGNKNINVVCKDGFEVIKYFKTVVEQFNH